jgi:hypothetical protein
VIVLCVIVAFIATLAFLESHIRSIEHAHSVGVEFGGHSPNEARRDAEARRTLGRDMDGPRQKPQPNREQEVRRCEHDKA